MDQKSCNTSIQCSVNSCAYNNTDRNCCSLQSIKVGCCNGSALPSARVPSAHLLSPVSKQRKQARNYFAVVSSLFLF